MAAVADRSTPGAMAAVAATIARLDSGAPTLTVSELRVELAKLDVEPQQVEACVERTDLEALLRERAADAEASGRFGAEAWRVAVANLAAATAADAAAAWLVGMEVPVACGCPASPLAVGACVFARERDGHTLQRPQRGIVNGRWCPSAQQPTRRPPTAPEAHRPACSGLPSWPRGGEVDAEARLLYGSPSGACATSPTWPFSTLQAARGEVGVAAQVPRRQPHRRHHERHAAVCLRLGAGRGGRAAA